MPWLLRDEDVLAAVEERRPGWQSGLTGAVLVRRPGLVQTLTGPAPADLDTAWCVPADIPPDRNGYRVRRIAPLAARRLSVPRLGSGVLVVAPAGSFERWKLSVGDVLEVRGD